MSTNSPTSQQEAFASLSPAVMRASTVVFDNFEDFVQRKQRQPDGFSYGVTGTPTARLLEQKVAQLENGRHCVIAPSGAAALMTTVMGFVRGGDHLLVSAACYGALKSFAEKWLAQMGVEVELYRPDMGADIEALIKDNTRMICMEAPGTVTMEMQDIPAITAVARQRGVLTMLDNTWASPLGFAGLDHGVDFSIQAATKFLGGHSDVLMGCISMNDHAHYDILRETQSILGQQVSPEDCFLVLRGLETLKLRVAAQGSATLQVARHLAQHPMVERMMYPPLESDPGHALWKRDYRTHGCLFSMILKPGPEQAFHSFFDSLQHFVIGASWGGVHSLAAYYPATLQANRAFPATDQPVVRLSIGLEDSTLLIADLDRALAAYAQAQTAG
ncbi:MAG TPA: aminotransferase class V-fold PLP-dependent enzyme [Herbaspirillum sp.]|uniref:trans-sulfuration enzyme family protein n=1 Tax=Herbaspirillum sp. TaxID=1890675 RepID=UPI002D4E51A0|nr:aminotransferase class V-fold PLP-dependent enzyme [Herbaspirillum sp.]HZG20983.1 aminotransferase class V-fold PLP-dependent enzyme [Herbaspirillum sp.]